MLIATILKDKGSDVVTVPAMATATEIAAVLSARRIGAVLVLAEGEAPLGIVSERDIVRALAAHGGRALDMTAARLMTPVRHTLRPDSSVQEAMATMTDKRVRHLPVLDGGRLAGMISIGDVVKARIAETDQAVDALTAYVAGG